MRIGIDPLKGAIIGDIAGSIYEWNSIKKKEFGPLFKVNSHFTDDTVMTIAVAKWLRTDGMRSPERLVDIMKEIGRKYDVGYGPRFKAWLHSDTDRSPYNSFGNGSAMRVSPVACVANNISEVIKLAKITAMVTHNHPEGLKGANATACAIWQMHDTGWLENRKQDQMYGYDMSRSVSQIRSSYKFEVSCQKSVPEAITCALEAKDFEDAIRNAISLGGDADTQACIAGSIAASMFGVPDEIWQEAYEKLDSELQKEVKLFGDYLITL